MRAYLSMDKIVESSNILNQINHRLVYNIYSLMSNSIFDTLQKVQVTDDDSNHFNNRQLSSENTDRNNLFQDSDQNPHMKVSCSTKISSQMASSWSQKSKSSLARPIFPSKNCIPHENTGNCFQMDSHKTEIRKLDNKDKFECQSCSQQPSKSCQICHGKIQLTGNDKLVKFFEYVLEFKLGRKQSYKPKEEKVSSKRSIPNEHCNIYFSAIAPNLEAHQGPSHNFRFSLGNDISGLASMGDYEERADNCRQIHHGFQCDGCKLDPIEGPRYHCSTCQDFDFCEMCYRREGHCHKLEKVEIKSNKRPLQKISNLLKFTNSSGLRSSIKNGRPLGNMLGNKACRSWIR